MSTSVQVAKILITELDEMSKNGKIQALITEACIIVVNNVTFITQTTLPRHPKYFYDFSLHITLRMQ